MKSASFIHLRSYASLYGTAVHSESKTEAEYKFAVLTYGARKCDAVEIWDRISRKADNAFDYISTIIMVDNWLPNFDMNEQLKIDKHIPENLQKITQISTVGSIGTNR